mmetsp:Transcript_131536/g.232403  ORF Transcript_131536/g.232403 Transcript_131536/m.232403 type:complete len:281 (-) Transcript_131536:102-944(-)
MSGCPGPKHTLSDHIATLANSSIGNPKPPLIFTFIAQLAIQCISCAACNTNVASASVPVIISIAAATTRFIVSVTATATRFIIAITAAATVIIIVVVIIAITAASPWRRAFVSIIVARSAWWPAAVIAIIVIITAIVVTISAAVITIIIAIITIPAASTTTSSTRLDSPTLEALFPAGKVHGPALDAIPITVAPLLAAFAATIAFATATTRTSATGYVARHSIRSAPSPSGVINVDPHVAQLFAQVIGSVKFTGTTTLLPLVHQLLDLVFICSSAAATGS